MLGNFQVQLGADQMVSGTASSDYAPDGELGTSSFSINPWITPGIIKSTAAATDKSTNVAGTLIASAEDSQSVTSYNRIFVDDAANYYSYNGSSITKQNTGVATSKYTPGFTDMASFSFNTYVTLTDNVAQWNTSTNTLDETWWTGTKGQAALQTATPHPLFVFENLLWIGDKNVLNSVTTGGTVAIGVLTLNSNERIQALGIDPGTGLMMISVQMTQNYSDTLASKFYVYLYDGYSSKPRRKIEVDDLVTAFHNVGGTVYVGYGLSIGYWNGSGISFLRRLSKATYSGGDLAYKHHFGRHNNVLLVVNGADILAYGEVIAGKKSWFTVLRNPSGSTHISLVCNTGAGKIGIAFASSQFWIADLTSSSAGVGNLFFGFIDFPRPVYVRRVRVVTDGITTTVPGIGGFAMIDEKGGFTQSAVVNFINTGATKKYVFDFDFGALEVQSVQPRVTFSDQGFGIYRVIIYYDPKE